MTEYTDERGDRWKVLTHPRKVLDAYGEKFVWTVEVEQVPAPATADDWATRAANACMDISWCLDWRRDTDLVDRRDKFADIIREHAPKVASEPTLLKAALECADDLERWQRALRDIADTVEEP
jgi:hypothetical protein